MAVEKRERRDNRDICDTETDPEIEPNSILLNGRNCVLYVNRVYIIILL